MRTFIVILALALVLSAFAASSAAIDRVDDREVQAAGPTGGVDVNFKSDYFPLERFT